MTLESALPWLSLAAAVGAGIARPGRSGRLEAGLRVLAFGALAVFAYFRWLAPAAIPLALTLETIGQAVLPWRGARQRRLASAFPIAGWLVLTQLFWSSGDGRLGVFTDAAKAALLVALLLGVGLGLRRIWPRAERPRLGIAVAAGALMLMAAMALTLDWGLWPALIGAFAILVSQALLADETPDRAAAMGGWARRASWALAYAGYAAVAYAFMR